MTIRSVYTYTYTACYLVSSFFIFRDHPGSAVHLSQVDSVVFRHCTFYNNIQKDLGPDFTYSQCYSEQHDHMFFLDSQPTAGAVSVYSYQHDIKLLVSGCTFTNNVALNNMGSSIPRSLFSHGHGGAMFIHFVNSSNSQVCIENTVFNNNTAQANGGALQLSTANNSIGNEIMILNSTFSGNNCTLKTCFGGAVGVDYVLDSKIKILHIFNSSFIDNQADAGGALGLLTSISSTYEDESLKSLWFRNCLFDHNMARQDGSALSLFSITPISERNFPIFIDNW